MASNLPPEDGVKTGLPIGGVGVGAGVVAGAGDGAGDGAGEPVGEALGVCAIALPRRKRKRATRNCMVDGRFVVAFTCSVNYDSFSAQKPDS
jgi:hypothetical protein